MLPSLKTCIDQIHLSRVSQRDFPWEEEVNRSMVQSDKVPILSASWVRTWKMLVCGQSRIAVLNSGTVELSPLPLLKSD